MSRERYRISTATCATYIEDGRQKLVTVPAGSLLEIRDLDVTSENPLSDVRWNGRLVRMFTVDLLARAERLRVEAN